ncbi:MAG: GNAT family N-acetyltransferase [Antarcticimicrobium sp.]|uniref:GNAT family N-acetyltransferase n=1 Tax=Antarcticimicrobium sp. TaxID=2824147 RepID=UPI00261A528E|nr:GNAT family N-acetyltransferase [Antarcticimicrobium sp.]MDF1718579.1 GNAT family N-acetyltransferase [Antarcticimicrobium sp.]
MTALAIPTLETERLILRAPGPQDFGPFAAFYASPRADFVGGPLNAEGSWRMLAMEIGHWTLKGFGRWTVTAKGDDTAIGMVGLFEPEGWPEAEIGWDLFNGHEGKGYATEAGRAARSYAYDVLGWQTAISLVKPANTGSARVAARLGARHEGDFTHERHGFMQVWRHPAPGEIADGGMEAYA